MERKNNTHLVGDIRYTENAKEVFRDSDNPEEFLNRLQNLMKEFGVVKLDVSIDPYLF